MTAKNTTLAALAASVRNKLRRAATEDTVEDYLYHEVESLGGRAFKLIGPPGWPDRTVLLPGGILAFFELKRPYGGRDEPQQPYWQRWLKRMGFHVFKCKNKHEVDKALAQLTGA